MSVCVTDGSYLAARANSRCTQSHIYALNKGQCCLLSGFYLAQYALYHMEYCHTSSIADLSQTF